MDRRQISRIDLLENRLRWQKRAIIGLIVVFLFNTSPILGTASEWFNDVFSSKANSSSSFLGKSSDKSDFFGVSDNGSELMSSRAELFDAETQGGVLSKRAHAVGDILQVSGVHILNEKGTAVAIVSYDTDGNGGVWIFNKDSKEVASIGVSKARHGVLTIRNASEKIISGIGSDGTDKGNGIIQVNGESKSFSRLGVNETGNAFVSVSNKSGVFVSGIVADERGHGLLTVSNVSGSHMASVGAHASGEGNGVLGVLGESGIFAELAVSEVLGATLRVSNKNGRAVSAIGADENGHGILGILNVLGLPVAAIGADDNGVGILNIGRKFGVFVNEHGTGVAETLTSNGSVRWSSEMTPGGGAPPQSGLLGDLDGDGDVDFTDFLVFAQNFGKTSG